MAANDKFVLIGGAPADTGGDYPSLGSPAQYKNVRTGELTYAPPDPSQLLSDAGSGMTGGQLMTDGAGNYYTPGGDALGTLSKSQVQQYFDSVAASNSRLDSADAANHGGFMNPLLMTAAIAMPALMGAGGLFGAATGGTGAGLTAEQVSAWQGIGTGGVGSEAWLGGAAPGTAAAGDAGGIGTGGMTMEQADAALGTFNAAVPSSAIDAAVAAAGGGGADGIIGSALANTGGSETLGGPATTGLANTPTAPGTPTLAESTAGTGLSGATPTPASMLADPTVGIGDTSALGTGTASGSGNGLINSALQWAKANPTAALSIGNTLGGAVGGIGRGAAEYLAAQKNAELQKQLIDKRVQAELALLSGKTALSAANAYQGSVPFTTAGAPGTQILRRPDGSLVYSPGSGLISNAMRSQ